MSGALADLGAQAFLVFTRIAACMMLLPGFASAQVPVNIRLFVAFAIAAAVLPVVHPSIRDLVDPGQPLAYLGLIGGEILVGALLALPARFLMAALSFLGEVIMAVIGLNPIPGLVGEDGQVTTALSALLNAAAVTLFFVIGIHAQFILALAASYTILLPGELADPAGALQRLASSLGEAFVTVLRLGAPFVIMTLAVNVVAGIVNKMTPQIPVYFVATPFLIAAGAILLYWIGDDMLALFGAAMTRLPLL